MKRPIEEILEDILEQLRFNNSERIYPLFTTKPQTPIPESLMHPLAICKKCGADLALSGMSQHMC